MLCVEKAKRKRYFYTNCPNSPITLFLKCIDACEGQISQLQPISHPEKLLKFLKMPCGEIGLCKDRQSEKDIKTFCEGFAVLERMLTKYNSNLKRGDFASSIRMTKKLDDQLSRMMKLLYCYQ